MVRASKKPSRADLLLIEHARVFGLTVTVKQLARWRQRGLLPGNVQKRAGRGRGSTSQPPPEAFELVVWLARHARRGGRPGHLALQALGEGLPVPEPVVRAAFRIPIEALDRAIKRLERLARLGKRLNAEDRIAKIAAQAVNTDRGGALVPARMRRIDRRLTRQLKEAGLTWPSEEFAAFDQGPTTEEPYTHADFITDAVTMVLTGGAAVHPELIGQVTRATNPAQAANPIASLAEHTLDDPDGETLFPADGGIAVIPKGDLRDTLRLLLDAASLEELSTVWQAAGELRTWVLELCQRVESLLDAGQPIEAAQTWLPSRSVLVGMLITRVLAERRRSVATQADTALLFLLMWDAFRRQRALIPGCQWELLEDPAVFPPPLRPLLIP